MSRRKPRSFGEIAEDLVALADGEGREAESAKRLLRHVEAEHLEHELPIPDSVNDYIWERRRLGVAQYRDWRTIEDVPEHLVEWAHAGRRPSKFAALEILDVVRRCLDQGRPVPSPFGEFVADAINATLESDSPSLDRELGLRFRRGRPARLLVRSDKDCNVIATMTRHIQSGKSAREAARLAAKELDPENWNDASENYRKLYRNLGEILCTKPTEEWTERDSV